MKFTVGKNALLPADAQAVDLLHRCEIGTPVSFDVPDGDGEADRLRRYIFMVIRRLAKACNVDPDALRAGLLIKTGRFTAVKVDDRHVITADSMNRASMSAGDLRDFWSDARPSIDEALSRIEDEADRREIEEMLNAPH